MANDVTHIIQLRGEKQQITKMLEAIQNDELGIGSIDFNKIIPMPEALNIECGSRTGLGIVIEEAMLLSDQLTSEMDENEDAPDMAHPQNAAGRYFDKAEERGSGYSELKPVLRSVTRLLHHVGTIFREETPVQSGGIGVVVDSKLRRKIREKKMAQGHKADDHEPGI